MTAEKNSRMGSSPIKNGNSQQSATFPGISFRPLTGLSLFHRFSRSYLGVPLPVCRDQANSRACCCLVSMLQFPLKVQSGILRVRSILAGTTGLCIQV